MLNAIKVNVTKIVFIDYRELQKMKPSKKPTKYNSQYIFTILGCFQFFRITPFLAETAAQEAHLSIRTYTYMRT